MLDPKYRKPSCKGNYFLEYKTTICLPSENHHLASSVTAISNEPLELRIWNLTKIDCVISIPCVFTITNMATALNFKVRI